MKNTKRKAFTLVELLVVIAIIGILFVVLISKVDFATEKSKASGVQTDFRSYQLAIETVARENAGLSTLVDDDASGAEKYAALEAALNKNLDPKLRVEIDENGNIITDAKDPWKEQYLGTYLAPDADGTVKDRGAIVMYSKGSNLKLGSTAEITNGVVNVTIESGKEAEGADDYAISTIYTYVNGYGEIKTTTDGFSNDMGDENTNQGNNTPANPGDPDEPDNGGSGEEPVQLAAGLYTDNTYSVMAMSWQEMTDAGIVSFSDIYNYFEFNVPDDLQGALVLPKDDRITEITGWICDIATKLTGIVIPNGVTVIDGGAFMDCTLLESVVLPDSVTTIRTSAFYGCSGLTSINMPENLTNLETCAFLLCDNLSYNEYKGAKYLGSKQNTYKVLMDVEDTTLDTYTIHSETEIIYESVFFGCSNLTHIAIPEKIKSIGQSAFNGCSSLESIIIPDSVVTLGDMSFDGCVNLEDVTLSKNIKKIGSGTFCSCSKLSNLVIPDSVTHIDSSVFYSSGLTTITLPENIEYIAYSAFDATHDLSTVIFNGTIEQWTELVNNCGLDAYSFYNVDHIQCSNGQYRFG